MLVTLSTPTFDLEGFVELDASPADTDLPATTRRVSRIATLDGGAVVNDFGHSYADQIMVLRWSEADPEKTAAVERMVRLYSRLRMSCDQGVFAVVPQDFSIISGQHRMVLLITERLDQ
jgi:hypothetical protein